MRFSSPLAARIMAAAILAGFHQTGLSRALGLQTADSTPIVSVPFMSSGFVGLVRRNPRRPARSKAWRAKRYNQCDAHARARFGL